MRKPRRLITALILLLVILFPVTVCGFESKETTESLRGIKNFYVTVKYIPGTPARGGLEGTEQLTEEIKHKLLKAGINVLMIEKYGSDGHLPRIDLKTYTTKLQNKIGYLGCIRIKVIQRAQLSNSSKESIVVTWSSDYSGVRQTLDLVKLDINSMVDVFINSWLSVNSPE